MSKRKALPTATRMGVLHESGYKCSNPACRMVLTLDIHHIEYITDGGGNGQENLLLFVLTVTRFIIRGSYRNHL